MVFRVKNPISNLTLLLLPLLLRLNLSQLKKKLTHFHQKKPCLTGNQRRWKMRKRRASMIETQIGSKKTIWTKDRMNLWLVIISKTNWLKRKKLKKFKVIIKDSKSKMTIWKHTQIVSGKTTKRNTRSFNLRRSILKLDYQNNLSIQTFIRVQNIKKIL